MPQQPQFYEILTDLNPSIDIIKNYVHGSKDVGVVIFSFVYSIA